MKGKKLTSIAKITRPRISGVIDRKRLFKLLDSGRKKPIIWVSAPAGSGKTTLVSSYLDARKLPYIWYQLDEGDSDTSTFFYYMGLAAKKAAPRYRKSLPLLTPEYLMGIPTFTKRYFEELFRRLPLTLSLSRKGRGDERVSPPLRGGVKGEGARGFVIVLDNYQDVNPESQFHELINNGFSAIPEGMTLIVISRAEQPPHFARLKANKKMSFIGWDEVRFTHREAKRVIKKHSNLKLKADHVMHLYSETDGWIAGLVLLLERMQTNYASPSPIKKIPRDELFDYLAEEVFNRIDKEKQDFLLKTSFLPEISSGIAESLSGIRNASKVLSELNRNQFFTDRLSQAEPVYKYHPLFREFLQARAKESFEQKEMTLIKRTAARLLKESGRPEESARLLIDAGDRTGLTELIMTHAGPLLEQGRIKTLEEWLKNIPPDMLERDPWLLYWKGVCRFFFSPRDGRIFFEKAFNLFVKGRRDTTGIFLSWAGVVESIFYSFEDFSQADRWVPLLDNLIKDYGAFPSAPVEARVASIMFNVIVMRKIKRSDFDLWLDRALSYPDPALKAHTLFHKAFYYICKGDFENAGLAVDSMRQISGSRHAPPFGRINLKLIETIYFCITDNYDRGMEAAIEGLKIADETGVHILDFMLVGHGMLSSFYLSDTSTARALSIRLPADMERLRPWDKSFYHYVRAFESFMSGEYRKAAVHSGSAMKLAIQVGHPDSLMLCNFLNAHILHRLGEHREASRCLDGFFQFARTDNNEMTRFAYHISKAQFALERCDKNSALRYLKQGVIIGKKRGYTGTYMGLPFVNAGLCAFALENNIESDYIQNLIRKRRLVPEESMLHVDDWPYPLKIYTLGSFSIEKDGAPIPFIGSLKVPLLMLKALIAFGGKDVETEQIIDALWPDTEGDAAHKSFEITLSRLRRLIGSDKALILMKNRLTINPQACWVDVAAFDHGIRRAERAWNSIEEQKNARDKHSEKTSGGALQLTRKALAVYKGHFLPFDMRQAWVMPMREHLSSKALRVIIRMGKYLEQAGSLEEALGFFEKGLEIDHLAEEIYQHLMICNHCLGRKAEAVKVYNRCRSALSVSLGIIPSPKTEEIYSSIL